MAIEIHQVFDEESGCSLIDTVKLVPPFEKKNGVCIEYVDEGLMFNNTALKILSDLGLINTGEWDINYLSYIFVRKRHYWIYKTLSSWRNLQMPLIRWLYRHGRLFQPIPRGERFQWSYFTPIYSVLLLKPILKRYKYWIDNIGILKEG